MTSCTSGMVGIIDPPRPEARTAIAEAHAAGVRIIMITGDHPAHRSRASPVDLGIVDGEARAMTGAEIEALDEDGLRAAVGDVSVYARVAPEHKLRIVDALQAEQNIVAMTGDGVNDAPALKSADIGVAMGITGTDVSKEAADMILADDNFATIIIAVREGRAIFANIRKFLRFLLSSNIGEVFTMFFGVVLAGVIGLDDTGEAISVPLLATQILWINLLTDTAPALAMGVDPPPDDVMGRPPRRMTDRVIDKEMWIGIVWVGLVMAVVTLDRARPPPRRRTPRRIGRHRRGPHDGVHDARLRPAVQRVQRPLGSHERVQPPVHEPAAVGRDRTLGRAPGRRGPAAVPQRRVRHHPARRRRLAALHRAGQHRALGRRSQEADAAVGTSSCLLTELSQARRAQGWEKEGAPSTSNARSST